MSQRPEFTLTIVLRPDESAALPTQPGATTVMAQVAVVLKRHHLDDAGTVDAVPLGDLPPQQVDLSDRGGVVAAIRGALDEQAEQLNATLDGYAQVDGITPPRTPLPRLPLEIDIDHGLATATGVQYPLNVITQGDDDR